MSVVAVLAACSPSQGSAEAQVEQSVPSAPETIEEVAPGTSSADEAVTSDPNADDAEIDVAGESGRVSSVVDGDTFDIDLNGVTERVRFIGINTPEVGECFADEATEALTLAIDGQIVRLETDVSDRDRNGRLLRYVFLGDELINETLVASGLAIAQRFDPDTARSDRFEVVQEQARQEGIGMWAADACGSVVENLSIEVDEVEFDAPGDDSQNLNGEWVVLVNRGVDAIDLTGWILKDETASHRFPFPAGFQLEPDGTVQIFSGCGSNTSSTLYWCTSGSAIWNNSGDTVFVLDANGNIVVSVNY